MVSRKYDNYEGYDRGLPLHLPGVVSFAQANGIASVMPAFQLPTSFAAQEEAQVNVV